MAKKSDNKGLYALLGLAGVGALTYALWPREPQSTFKRTHSTYCRNTPDDPICESGYDRNNPADLKRRNDWLAERIGPTTPNEWTPVDGWKPPGGDSYPDPN